MPKGRGYGKVGPKKVKRIRENAAGRKGGATDMAMEKAQRKIKRKRAKRK
jgi:hypothetical protein